MKSGTHLFAIVILWIMIPMPMMASPPERSATEVQKKKKVELWYVISQLRKEGMQAWREDDSWSRKEPNYSQEKNWSLNEPEGRRALARKLSKEPAVDAYIKWQLLSFVDRLEVSTPKQLNPIVRRMPRIVAQPVIREEWVAVSGPQSAYIAVTQQTPYVADIEPVVGNNAVGLNPVIGLARSGAVMSVEGSTISYITIIRNANARLQNERFFVDRANEMIGKYRRELALHIPKTNGLRLAWMLHDATERVTAGDPGTRDVLLDLLDETEQLPEDLSPEMRQSLVADVKKLGEIETEVHDSLGQGERENDAIIYTHTVSIPSTDIETLQKRIAPTEE